MGFYIRNLLRKPLSDFNFILFGRGRHGGKTGIISFGLAGKTIVLEN
jgi:hypothetical protein